VFAYAIPPVVLECFNVEKQMKGELKMVLGRVDKVVLQETDEVINKWSDSQMVR
jgi:hypothetical protein